MALHRIGIREERTSEAHEPDSGHIEVLGHLLLDGEDGEEERVPASPLRLVVSFPAPSDSHLGC